MEGRAGFVEGVVTDFNGGIDNEGFKVNGKEFSCSGEEANAGFKQMRFRGGPISPGMKARIWHIRGNIIKLEVAKNIRAKSGD